MGAAASMDFVRLDFIIVLSVVLLIIAVAFYKRRQQVLNKKCEYTIEKNNLMEENPSFRKVNSKTRAERQQTVLSRLEVQETRLQIIRNNSTASGEVVTN